MRVIQVAVQRFNGDKEVMLAAVARDGLALEDASDRLKRDPEIVLTAVRGDRYARGFKYDSTELKADKNFVLAAADENGLALQYAASE